MSGELSFIEVVGMKHQEISSIKKQQETWRNIMKQQETSGKQDETTWNIDKQNETR